MAWKRLCGIFDLPVRGGRVFMDVADDLDLIIFRVEGGNVIAYDAACPHAGALLRPENEMGGVLVCYIHHWRFKVDTGECLDVPQCPLIRYPAQIKGFDVMVDPDNPVT